MNKLIWYNSQRFKSDLNVKLKKGHQLTAVQESEVVGTDESLPKYFRWRNSSCNTTTYTKLITAVIIRLHTSIIFKN